MGVVGCPNVERNFDGRIYLRRVSKQKKVAKASRNRRFAVDVQVNEELTNGDWRRMIVDTNITAREALDLIIDVYDLDAFVAERLIFYYTTHTGAGNNKQFVDIRDEQRLDTLGMFTDENGNHGNDVTLETLTLCVKLRKGDEVEEDCSCDSDFMLQWMPKVGQAMRDTYHWIPITEKLYLVMDNAGGHGTSDAKDIYVNAMKEYNVEIIWQVPRSPETNMLDLGVWMSIQSAVTRVHHNRRSHVDALATSIEDAWTGYLSEKAFHNVHRRLKVVLQSIVKDEGGNELVEEHRGKLFRDATIIDLTSVDDEEDINLETNLHDNDHEELEDDLLDVDSDIGM